MSRTHSFSRALGQLHAFAFAMRFDWFIGLFKSLVIGQSKQVSVGFYLRHSIENRSICVWLLKWSHYSSTHLIKWSRRQKGIGNHCKIRPRQILGSIHRYLGFIWRKNRLQEEKDVHQTLHLHSLEKGHRLTTCLAPVTFPTPHPSLKKTPALYLCKRPKKIPTFIPCIAWYSAT